MDERSFEARDRELRREMAEIQSKLNSLKAVMGETLRSADRSAAEAAAAQLEATKQKVRDACLWYASSALAACQHCPTLNAKP
eukprot:9455687-Pyramimonas_sp.AAC.1